MKIIIAGSREITDYDLVERAAYESGWIDENTEIVSGMAKGVDTLAVEFAEKHHFPLHKFPANWEKYGRPAGMIRNDEMAQFADALVAVWDGRSVGTRGMIEIARARRLKILIYRTDIETVMVLE